MFGRCKCKQIEETKYICPEMKMLNYECPALKEMAEAKCPLREDSKYKAEFTCTIDDPNGGTPGKLIIGDTVYLVYIVERTEDMYNNGGRLNEKGVRQNGIRCNKKSWVIIQQ